MLAARREATVAAQVAAALRARAAASASHPDAPPTAASRGRTVFGFVDRVGRLHTWPGLLRERHVR